MADFTGFYFNHIHSSTYNIYRVSNGSRFEEGLLPDFEDFSVSVVGGDGDLYQGRRFKPITFKINIAYDNLSELNLRQLRNWLAPGDLCPLQFDERPYKTYFAKLSSRPILNYVCFMEDDDGDNVYSGGPTEFTPPYDGFVPKSSREPVSGPTTTAPITVPTKQRVYKGEGELTFTAYDPFGYCIDESWEMTAERGLIASNGINWQDLGEYIPPNDWNGAIDEWSFASRLLTSEQLHQESVNVPYRDSTWTDPKTQIEYEDWYVNLYNAGDFKSDIQIFFDFDKGLDTFTSDEDILVTLQMQHQKYRKHWDADYLIPEPYTIWEPAQDDFSFKVNGLRGYNHVLLNSKNHSCVVYPSIDTRKEIDMRYDLIKGVDWLQVPQGRARLKISIPTSIIGQNFRIAVKYNYKYY